LTSSRIYLFAVITLIAFRNVPCGYAQEADVPAREPVWSEQIDFNAINDIDTDGKATGYLAGNQGRVLVSRDKGTKWDAADISVSESIRNVYAGDDGVVFAVTEDTYYYSDNYGETWHDNKFADGYVSRSIGYSSDGGGSVWKLEYKERSTDGKFGAVRVQVSADRGHNWSAGVQVPYLPYAIKPVDKETAWGYDAKNVYRFTQSGQHVEVVDAKLGRGENLVRGVVWQGTLVVASSTGRLFRIDDTLTIAPLPGPSVERLEKFILFADGGAAVIDGKGAIYQTANLASADWKLAGAFPSTPALLFGWAGGGFLSKSADGNVLVRPSAGQPDRVVFEVLESAPFRIAAVNQGYFLLATRKGEVFRSGDHGLSWSRHFKDASGISQLAANAHGIAALTSNESLVYESRDGGVSWSELSALPVKGTVGRLLVDDHDRISVEILDGYYPYGESRLFQYDRITAGWKSLGVTTAVRLLGAVPGGEIRGLNYDGSMSFRAPGQEEKSLPTNLMDLLKRRAPDEKTTNIFLNWFWMNQDTGWVFGRDGLIFKTADRGKSWTDTSLVVSADIKYLHYFDARNGLVYGESSDGMPQVNEYYATTTDGGRSWTSHNALGVDDFVDWSFAADGEGMINMKSGILYLSGLEVSNGLAVSVEQSLLGALTFRVSSQAEDTAGEALKGISLGTLWYRVDRNGGWLARTVRKEEIILDGKHQASFVWNPRQSIGDLAPGASIETRVVLTMPDDELTFNPPPVVYLGWVKANQRLILIASLCMFALLLVSALIGGILWLKPALFVRLATASRDRLNDVAELLPGQLKSVVKLMAKSGGLDRLAKSRRAVDAWITRYGEGKVRLQELSETLLDHYLQQPRLLDIWVAQRVESCRERLRVKREQFGISVYVPMGLTITGKSQSTRVDSPSSRALREFVNTDRGAIGIIGEGGIGKTALLGQLADWATREEADERLLDHISLAILLHGEVGNVMQAIREELQVEYVEQDSAGCSEKVVAAALRERRIVLFFDGLSESSPATQDVISHIFSELKMGLLILTARKSYSHLVSRWTQVSLDQVAPESVNRFLSQYIHEKSLEMEIAPRAQLALSEQLLRLLEGQAGKSTLPPIFLVLFIESLRAEPARIGGPTTLAATVQRYVRSLRPAVGHPLSDPELFASLAATLAVVSLQPNFIPSEFDFEKGEEALGLLKQVSNPSEVILTMISANLLIDRMGAAGRRIRFRLDPVAEYLAAIRNTKKFASVELWQEHLACLSGLHDVQRDALGYVSALLECITSIGGDYGTPEWVSLRLQELTIEQAEQQAPQ
jgi:photosystem II stability/assembly factor-like uncharacterized protein